MYSRWHLQRISIPWSLYCKCAEMAW